MEGYMTSRYQAECSDVAIYLPRNTRHDVCGDRDMWTFDKRTEVGINFTITLYYDADEEVPGYCAHLIDPEIEEDWKSPHIGHIFADGIICFGGASTRTRRTS